jgi:hypothetical protein
VLSDPKAIGRIAGFCVEPVRLYGVAIVGCL